MASAFNQASADLTAQRTDADTQANATVDQINAIATQINSLNLSISKLVAVGQTLNDLLDSRDKLVDDLSKLANTQVTYSGNNVATVTVGGLTVVDPTGATTRTRAEFHAEFPSAMSPGSGKLGALLDAYQNVVPGYAQRLDSLAVSLHDDLNAVHQQGFDLHGNAGGLLFASASITSASQLAVNPVVLADLKLIAAAGTATAGPGDSSNMLATTACATVDAPAGLDARHDVRRLAYWT